MQWRLPGKQVIDEVFELVRPQAEKSGVSIECHVTESNKWNRVPEIQGDPFLFRLAIRGLVNNAIQALAESEVPIGQRRVEVSAMYSPRIRLEDPPEGLVEISVKDNGPGVARDRGRTYLTAGSRRAWGAGWGLGLGLVQSVAEATGIRCTVGRHCAGRGVSVARSGSSRARSNGMMDVIIVDDDGEFARDLKALLRTEGYAASVYQDFDSAYAALKDIESPYVLLLDHDLGDGQGRQGYLLCSELRRTHPFGLLLPVVYITGEKFLRLFSSGNDRRCFEHPNAFVSKGDLARNTQMLTKLTSGHAGCL